MMILVAVYKLWLVKVDCTLIITFIYVLGHNNWNKDRLWDTLQIKHTLMH